MNCANHPQNAVSAYCRTCGKPICNQCTRQVMGVIYCENCLAERVAGTAPPAGAFRPAPGYQGAIPQPTTGPNPALAGLLGAIPFGVGAIYCGQYVKGLVYLGIFVFLVVSLSSNLPDYMYPILGICMGFFCIYQIIDAVRTAKALQEGKPAPDPFGLVATFSPVEKSVATPSGFKSIPTGALVLIGLGILFLLHNLGLWFLRPGVVASLVLIAIGVWLFARRLDSADPSCRTRGIVLPAVLVTLGAQFLLDSLDVISFGRTLPVLLIVVGVAVVIQRSSPPPPDYYPPQPLPGSAGTQDSGVSSANADHSTEVKNG